MRNGKRIYVSAFKAWLVEQALRPEVSVAGLALRHGVNANQLRSWMKLEHWQSSPPTLLPVTVAADARPAEVVATTNARQPEAVMEIEVCGHCHPSAWPSGYRATQGGPGRGARMIGLPANTRVWIVAGHTDMRKGFDGLAAMVQGALSENPFSGHVFFFRGRRGDILKVQWFDGQGLLLLSKRLERGRFVWPQAACGGVSLCAAQPSMLLEGIDWRMPARTHRPDLAA